MIKCTFYILINLVIIKDIENMFFFLFIKIQLDLTSFAEFEKLN